MLRFNFLRRHKTGGVVWRSVDGGGGGGSSISSRRSWQNVNCQYAVCYWYKLAHREMFATVYKNPVSTPPCPHIRIYAWRTWNSSCRNRIINNARNSGQHETMTRLVNAFSTRVRVHEPITINRPISRLSVAILLKLFIIKFNYIVLFFAKVGKYIMYIFSYWISRYIRYFYYCFFTI